MNYVVPDLAIVPRFEMSSFLVIPIPVSWMATVLASLSISILIESSEVSPNTSGFFME